MSDPRLLRQPMPSVKMVPARKEESFTSDGKLLLAERYLHCSNAVNG